MHTENQVKRVVRDEAHWSTLRGPDLKIERSLRDTETGCLERGPGAPRMASPAAWEWLRAAGTNGQRRPCQRVSKTG